MGTFTTENQDTFKDILKAFSEANYDLFGGHAYEAGFLQSLSTRMLDFMPKKYQKQFIEDMIRETQKAEHRLIARSIEKIKD
jgi:hypothetical protein